MHTCAASAASRPSGIATTAVRGVCGTEHVEGGERSGGGGHPAGIRQGAGRGARAAQLVRDPPCQLELGEGRRGDTDRGGGGGAEQADPEDEERERHLRRKQTRVTRRRSTRSTTTRNPSSVSSSPGRGTRPSAE